MNPDMVFAAIDNIETPVAIHQQISRRPNAVLKIKPPRKPGVARPPGHAKLIKALESQLKPKVTDAVEPNRQARRCFTAERRVAELTTKLTYTQVGKTADSIREQIAALEATLKRLRPDMITECKRVWDINTKTQDQKKFFADSLEKLKAMPAPETKIINVVLP